MLEGFSCLPTVEMGSGSRKTAQVSVCSKSMVTNDTHWGDNAPKMREGERLWQWRLGMREVVFHQAFRLLHEAVQTRQPGPKTFRMMGSSISFTLICFPTGTRAFCSCMLSFSYPPSSCVQAPLRIFFHIRAPSLASHNPSRFFL